MTDTSQNARRRPGKRTRGAIADAYSRAAQMGALVLLEPHARRSDGSPLLKDDEVYVTKTGVRYHPQWCQIMAERWDTSKAVFVTRLTDVGKRELCGACQEPLTSSRVSGADFTFERKEWMRLQDDLNKQARSIADYLTAKGPDGISATRLRIRVNKYRETQAELKKLSLRVAGVFPESGKAPNW